MIENTLERIATALEAIAGMTGTVPAKEPVSWKNVETAQQPDSEESSPVEKVKPSPTSSPDTTVEADITQLVDAASAAFKRNKRKEVEEVINSVGAKKMTQVKPEDVAAVVARIEAL